jgi:hypothetical protein
MPIVQQLTIRYPAANVRRLMKEETMGSIATVFPEETDHAGTYEKLFLRLIELTLRSKQGSRLLCSK